MRFRMRAGAGLPSAVAAITIGLAVLGQPGPAIAQDLPGGTWGTPLPVNLAAADPAGTYYVSGNVSSVSCASAGNCVAFGNVSFRTPTEGMAGTAHPVLIDETSGAWGTPQLVPGIPDSTAAIIGHLSCAAPGDCSAAVTSPDVSGNGRAYLINESGGTWGQALPVTPGTVSSSLSGVSCTAPGDCTAVGSDGVPFVMDSTNGVWDTPQQVQGIAALSSPSPTGAGLASVSCSSAGNCVAVGNYSTTSTSPQAYLVTETSGTWGQAEPVAGMAALAPGGWSSVRSVSCASSGECAMTGLARPVPGSSNVNWVATESGGSWTAAQPLAAPDAGTQPLPVQVSCAQGGYCVVVGRYVPSSGVGYQAFTATYSGGSWAAEDVPGLTGLTGEALNVSCAAPGDCGASGFYYPAGSGIPLPFAASDVNGTWGNAQTLSSVPGGVAEINDLSCPESGYCTAVGRAGSTLITVGQATAATVSLKASAPAVTYGNEQVETLTATVTSPAGGTPSGTVTVATPVNGHATGVCQITLSNGTGTCTVPSTALPGGTDQLTATYHGDASYAAATSATTPVTVTPAASTTTATVSPSTVAFGTNYKSVVSVTVKSQYAGSPAGNPEFDLNGSTWCTPTLTAGKASCAVATGLNAGRYAITAHYLGDGNFAASASATQYLTITKQKTSLGLTLAKTAITDGHETAEKFTVKISAAALPSKATGKVIIKTSRTTLCVITVKNAGGSCTLRAWQLKAGTYWLWATYSGDVNFLASNSAGRSLKVAA